MSRLLKGIPGSPGIVIGPAKVLTLVADFAPSSRLTYNEADMNAELDRFEVAVTLAEEELTALKSNIAAEFQEHAHLLEVQLMILKDRMLYDETHRQIKEHNLNAERALYQAFQRVREVFRRIGDPYIKGRLQDVEGVYRRLMSNLAGEPRPLHLAATEPVIIVSRDLSPAETTQMTRAQVLGFITERGGRTSHTAIMAQALEIPAVVGLDNATREIASGDTVILDGLTGRVILDPDDQVQRVYQTRQQAFEGFKEQVAESSSLAATTLDDYTPRVMANIELPEEVGLAQKNGADGVGLYRTEFLFLRLRHLPTQEELFQDYRRVVEAMTPLEVTIRTLDIGGDKFLSSMEYPVEMNPALGLRAIRFSLKEREIFRSQLKAIVRASAYGQVRLMFPLISGVEELQEARRLLAEVQDEVFREGLPCNPQMPVGAMIEVPAAVTLAYLLSRHVDFFSIGTNDLIQYALAIDRVNKQVADMYQPLHPAVLRMIRQVIQAAQAAGIKVAVCGEMAGDPLYTCVLLGLGVDELSMNATSVAVVKHVIRQITLAEAQTMARQALRLATVTEVNQYVTQEMTRRFPDIFRFGCSMAACPEI